MSGKPILVTGSHRSGSTWVGRMIAESPSIAYIHEPFHVGHRQGICGAEFKYWFTYICTENESAYYNDIKKTIEFTYNLRGGLKVTKPWKDLSHALREYSKFSVFRGLSLRPLIKDPVAIFSAEWLASRFDMDVVVLIRHPAAFAGSLKKVNWKHPFSHFLSQSLLMKHHLYPFETEIREYSEKEHDIIDQAILLWKLIHHMIIKYREKYSDWIFLRYEDISENPLEGFERLFERLNIDFCEKVRQAVIEHSSIDNPSEVPDGDEFSLKRNSKANIYNWKHRLTRSEIERVKEHVKDISDIFYSDKDW